MIKKADIVLFLILLAAGLAASFLPFAGGADGDMVTVTVDNRTYGVYSLSEDREIEIDDGEHINHITIKDGAVSMASSNCANQVCVETGAVSEAGRTIVCLPNRVIVEITSSKEDSPDAVAG